MLLFTFLIVLFICCAWFFQGMTQQAARSGSDWWTLWFTLVRLCFLVAAAWAGLRFALVVITTGG